MRESILLILLMGVACAVAFLAAIVWIDHQRLRRLETRGVQAQTTLEEGVTSLRDRVEGLAEHIDANSSKHSEELRAASSVLDRMVPDVANRVQRKMAHELRRAGTREFAEIEALLELRMLFTPQAPVPPTRGWAASPDVLRTLIEMVLNRRPGLVVECGSGASSIWMGYALRQVGHGRLVSLEHDSEYAEATNEYVVAHGLTDFVDVRHAGLQPWAHKDDEWPWYSLDAVEDLHEVGLVFVDGPPGPTRAHARYPALPVLLPRCAHDSVFVLDDADRTEEQEIVDRWLTEHPYLRHERFKHEKGCSLIFTR